MAILFHVNLNIDRTATQISFVAWTVSYTRPRPIFSSHNLQQDRLQPPQCSPGTNSLYFDQCLLWDSSAVEQHYFGPNLRSRQCDHVNGEWNHEVRGAGSMMDEGEEESTKFLHHYFGFKTMTDLTTHNVHTCCRFRLPSNFCSSLLFEVVMF